MKTFKKVLKTTVLLMCLVGSIFMMVLFIGAAMENAKYGIDDSDFALAVILSVTSTGWAVMSAEKLLGGNITINFERKES